MQKLLIIITLLIVSAICFAGTELRGKHLDNGLACADCHKTDAPTKRAPASSCMECHDGYPDIANITASVTPNPHDTHQGELRCTVCHNVHKPSVNYCADCHDFKFNVK